jgi:hypothetical protein
MGRGVFRIVLGVVFAIGGFTGNLVLIGTDSGALLGIVGLGLIGFGVYGILEAKKAAPPPSAPKA